MGLERLKKIICLALAVCLAFAAAGCKAKVDPEKAQAIQDAQAALEAGGEDAEPAEETPADEYAEAGLTALEEDDPLWEDAAFELPAIAQMLAYKALFPDAFDENDPAADDFWTVTGMGITAIPPENMTDFNKITHIHEPDALDYAAALLPGYEPGDAAPKLEDVYGISGNPKSDLIDVDGLSINVTPKIVLLGTDNRSGQLVMRVHIEEKEGTIAMTDWDVLLEPWGDGTEHALPLKVKQFYSVN